MRWLQPQYYAANGFSASEDSAILRQAQGVILSNVEV
jgi:hypothetical protein